MSFKMIPFLDLLENIVDNRGKTCPTEEDGIPLIATNCIRNENLFPSFEKIRFVSQETYDNWFRGHPQPGDMIFVTKGTPGRVCWVPDPVNFCIAQDMVAIRANKDLIYPKYLFALLRSPQIQHEIENMHVGTLIPHFKKGDFDKLFLPVFKDHDTQKKIGDIYFTFCDKIELNRRMNRTLEAMAQALFQKMCTVPAGEELPAGWAWKKVGEVVESVSNTYNFKSVEKVVFLNTSDIQQGFVLNREYSPTKGLPGQAKKSIKRGDILYSEIRPKNKRFAYVDFDSSEYVVSTKLMVLRSKGIVDNLFTYFFLTRDETVNFLNQLAEARSGTFPQITFSQLKDIEIVIPDGNTLNNFLKILQPTFQKIYQNQIENEKLAQLRDTLLPRLMSGELEV